MKKLLYFSAVFALIIGIAMISVGAWGLSFTYESVARENIVTTGDASIPNTPVRGPFTLKSQADVIRYHTLESTDGKTYAEMPRQIELLDDNGEVVLDDDGEQVMVSNESRNIWITATTLMTALYLAMVTYAFSILMIILGLFSLWNSLLYYVLAKKH